MNHVRGLESLQKLKVYKSWVRLDKLRMLILMDCEHTYINGICIKCLTGETGESLAYLREKELGSYAYI
jgi:hypothetical protein